MEGNSNTKAPNRRRSSSRRFHNLAPNLATRSQQKRRRRLRLWRRARNNRLWAAHNPLSRRTRRALQHIMQSHTYLFLQTGLVLFACAAYVYETYMDEPMPAAPSAFSTEHWIFFSIDIFVNFAFLLDFVFSILGFGREYCFSIYAVVDILCLVPALRLFYRSTDNLGWVRFFRVFKAVRILGLYRLLEIQRKGAISDTVGQYIGQLCFTLCGIVFVTTGIVHAFEVQDAQSFGDAYDEENTAMAFHEAFYFIIVTFSTVGYGDISPATTGARLTMVVSICVAFATIPSKVAQINKHMSMRSRFRTRQITSSREGGCCRCTCPCRFPDFILYICACACREGDWEDMRRLGICSEEEEAFLHSQDQYRGREAFSPLQPNRSMMSEWYLDELTEDARFEVTPGSPSKLYKSRKLRREQLRRERGFFYFPYFYCPCFGMFCRKRRINAYQGRRRTAKRPYSICNCAPCQYRDHVVVCGNISAGGLSVFLWEFLHPDHYQTREHRRQEMPRVVVLAPCDPVPGSMLELVLRQPHHRNHVIWLTGSAMVGSDLDRAAVQDALAVFVLTDPASVDPRGDDCRAVLRTLAVVRHDVEVLAFVQLHCPAAKDHLLRAGVVSECMFARDELMLPLLAHACRCPGFSTLISNLVSSHSMVPDFDEVDELLDEEDEDEFKGGVKGGNEQIESNWMKEYYRGASHEIYSLEVGRELKGLVFADVAAALYSFFEVALLGVETFEIVTPQHFRESKVHHGNDSQRKEEKIVPAEEVKQPIPLQSQKGRKMEETDCKTDDNGNTFQTPQVGSFSRTNMRSSKLSSTSKRSLRFSEYENPSSKLNAASSEKVSSSSFRRHRRVTRQSLNMGPLSMFRRTLINPGRDLCFQTGDRIFILAQNASQRNDVKGWCTSVKEAIDLIGVDGTTAVFSSFCGRSTFGIPLPDGSVVVPPLSVKSSVTKVRKNDIFSPKFGKNIKSMLGVPPGEESVNSAFWTSVLAWYQQKMNDTATVVQQVVERESKKQNFKDQVGIEMVITKKDAEETKESSSEEERFNEKMEEKEGKKENNESAATASLVEEGEKDSSKKIVTSKLRLKKIRNDIVSILDKIEDDMDESGTSEKMDDSNDSVLVKGKTEKIIAKRVSAYIDTLEHFPKLANDLSSQFFPMLPSNSRSVSFAPLDSTMSQTSHTSTSTIPYADFKDVFTEFSRTEYTTSSSFYDASGRPSGLSWSNYMKNESGKRDISPFWHRGESAANDSGHVILAGSIYRAELFVKALQSIELPEGQRLPITLLHPNRNLFTALKELGTVYDIRHVVGVPTRASDLARAGAKGAAAVCLLSYRGADTNFFGKTNPLLHRSQLPQQKTVNALGASGGAGMMGAVGSVTENDGADPGVVNYDEYGVAAGASSLSYGRSSGIDGSHDGFMLHAAMEAERSRTVDADVLMAAMEVSSLVGKNEVTGLHQPQKEFNRECSVKNLRKFCENGNSADSNEKPSLLGLPLIDCRRNTHTVTRPFCIAELQHTSNIALTSSTVAEDLAAAADAMTWEQCKTSNLKFSPRSSKIMTEMERRASEHRKRSAVIQSMPGMKRAGTWVGTGLRDSSVLHNSPSKKEIPQISKSASSRSIATHSMEEDFTSMTKDTSGVTMKGVANDGGNSHVPFLQPEYAAGQVFSAKMVDSLLGQLFYNADILSLLNGILGTGAGSNIYLWNVSTIVAAAEASHMENFQKVETYGALFQLLISGIEQKSGKGKWHSVVPLGLYRPKGCGKSILPYVCTNPPARTKLVDGDCVYVLA
eukprot:g2119.t1